MYWEQLSFSGRRRKEDLMETVSGWRLEGRERTSHADIWGKNFPGRESKQHKHKGFRMGATLACSSDS